MTQNDNSSTLVLEKIGKDTATLLMPAGSEPRAGLKPQAKPLAPDHANLVEQYRALLLNRSIPFPAHYQFIKELGHGRQGVVFLVHRQGARGCLTRHAIKLFDPGIYSSAQNYLTDMGRIASQISLLQPINHAHLTQGDFYEECNGIGYIQMPAIDGVDLQFLLDRKQIELARSRSTDAEWSHFTDILFDIRDGHMGLHVGMALNILRRLVRAVDVLHDNAFVHCDIKPTNIMIDEQGMLKMVDFGRAVRIGEKVNIILGSPLYMAPEIHRRQSGMAQSDLFSIGLVALEMLSAGQISRLSDLDEESLLDIKGSMVDNLPLYLPPSAQGNKRLLRMLARFLHPDPGRRFERAIDAESGEDGLLSTRQGLDDDEREVEYSTELERYLEKLQDPETGALNPHFASDNLTAVIMTN